MKENITRIRLTVDGIVQGVGFRPFLHRLAEKHGIEIQGLQTFIQEIIDRMIFDGEKLGDLLAPLDLSWRERTQKELDLVADLIPLLKKLADGHEIVGLNAYE